MRGAGILRETRATHDASRAVVLAMAWMLTTLPAAAAVSCNRQANTTTQLFHAVSGRLYYFANATFSGLQLRNTTWSGTEDECCLACCKEASCVKAVYYAVSRSCGLMGFDAVTENSLAGAVILSDCVGEDPAPYVPPTKASVLLDPPVLPCSDNATASGSACEATPNTAFMYLSSSSLRLYYFHDIYSELKTLDSTWHGTREDCCRKCAEMGCVTAVYYNVSTACGIMMFNAPQETSLIGGAVLTECDLPDLSLALPPASPPPPASKGSDNKKLGLIIGISLASALVLILLVAAAVCLVRKQRAQPAAKASSPRGARSLSPEPSNPAWDSHQPNSSSHAADASYSDHGQLPSAPPAPPGYPAYPRSDYAPPGYPAMQHPQHFDPYLQQQRQMSAHNGFQEVRSLAKQPSESGSSMSGRSQVPPYSGHAAPHEFAGPSNLPPPMPLPPMHLSPMNMPHMPVNAMHPYGHGAAAVNDRHPSLAAMDADHTSRRAMGGLLDVPHRDRDRVVSENIIPWSQVTALQVLEQQLDAFEKEGGLFLNKYKLMGCFARRHGGQGVVQFARLGDSGKHVAIKFFLSRPAFDTEQKLYDDSRIKHILPDTDAIYRNDDQSLVDPSLGRPMPPFVVMEKGEALSEWAQRRLPDYASCLQIIMHLAKRVVELHANNLVHCDLKPTNTIWLKSRNEWSIIDFGSSGTVGDFIPLSISLGYSAPELIKAYLRGETRCIATQAIDVWSIGVMSWELLTNTPAFPKGPELFDAVTRSVTQGLFPWEDPSAPNYSAHKRKAGFMYDSLIAMLQREPHERPSLRQVIDGWARDLRREQTALPVSGEDRGEDMSI